MDAVGQRVAQEGNGFIHQKIAEHEKENSGVEAAHKTEQAVEGVLWKVTQHKPDIYGFQRSRVAALEKKQFKAETNFRYQKFLEEINPINHPLYLQSDTTFQLLQYLNLD